MAFFKFYKIFEKFGCAKVLVKNAQCYIRGMSMRNYACKIESTGIPLKFTSRRINRRIMCITKSLHTENCSSINSVLPSCTRGTRSVIYFNAFAMVTKALVQHKLPLS